MKQPYELSVALRYLRARRGDSFISFISIVSMVGIGLAVAVLIVVLSVMNGFEFELQQRILGMASHASIHGYDGPLEDWQALRERALERGDVVAAAPFVEGQALAAAGDAAVGLSVRGVLPELEKTVSEVEGFMQAGDLGSLVSGEYRIVIGSGVAEALGVGIGDEVLLVLAQGLVTPVGITPRYRTFTVSGIFEAGMYEYDRGLVFVHFGDAARMLRTDGRASGLRLAVTDVYFGRDIATALARTLDERSYVNDWTRQHVNFFNSIRLSKAIMFVILSMVIAVAAFNIVSTLVMVVRDKKGDIAILRSFGASPRSVMTVFASQGTMIGLVGTAAGLLLGLLVTTQLDAVVRLIEASFDIDLLSAEVYFLGDLPSQVRAGEVAQIALVALALAVLATIYPALSAARQHPAEALRYE
ncbi:MAG: lipoprotein-releasing ABC transporter permease subunit [Gammaproteobacteria bacterium]|nr:lipoprotein-releasing ABC transporter permease subunit [Gammaproteobacteria bacterium]